MSTKTTTAIVICVAILLVSVAFFVFAFYYKPANPPASPGGLTIDEINASPVSVNSSGWLHTTKSGSKTFTVSPMATEDLKVETKGFRQITFVFTSNRDDTKYYESYGIGAESFTRGEFLPKIIRGLSGLYEVFETFDVISETMVIRVGNYADLGSPPATITINYFLTT